MGLDGGTINRKLRKLSRDQSADGSQEIRELEAQLEAVQDEVYYNISAETHTEIGDVENGFARIGYCCGG